jgi:hypothetical protein
MQFIPSIQIPVTDLPDGFRYLDNISAAGSSQSDATEIPYGGTLATLVKIAAGSSGTEGVKIDDANVPVGAQFWLKSNSNYTCKVYAPTGKNFFGDVNLASKAGCIVIKVSDDDYWRFG